MKGQKILFRVSTFAKRVCDNVLKPETRSNTLLYEGLDKHLNTGKELYRYCYIPSESPTRLKKP